MGEYKEKYSDALLQIEEAIAKEWGKCGCTLKCTRVKRSEESIHKSPVSKEADIGIGKVTKRRYSNDDDKTEYKGDERRSARQ